MSSHFMLTALTAAAATLLHSAAQATYNTLNGQAPTTSSPTW